MTMSEFVIAPVATPSLAVAGTSSRFPIRRVFCVGRNYSDHAREMGHDPDRAAILFHEARRCSGAG
jgi:fumarylpyruvate hydrolase